MKKKYSLVLLLAVLLFSLGIIAQTQEGDTITYKTLIPAAKQGLLKNMSMIANMQFAEQNEFVDGDYSASKFKMNQFRLEFKGQVHEKVYFRFRDRYTRAQTSESIDNLSRSVDLAFIRVDATTNLNFTMGKMCAAWGGFEFDYNPIDIYEYSDIIEMADNFLTGVGATYQANKNNSFTVQVLDSRTKTFEELYGPQPNFTEAQAPLAFVANWTGSLFDGKLKTMWGYALHTEAESTFMNYLALGQELTLGKLVVAYDFKLSNEDLDRTGIVSATVPDSLYPWALEDTEYIGHWMHIHYRLNDKVNLSLVGMMDIANWQNDTLDPLKTDNHIRTAWGYIPSVEYYPWKNLNLKFFANVVGRIYDYSDYASSRFGVADYNTARISVGFIAPLGIF
nr:porin [uncultured Flavobacterium sp.]